jgi:hypothetical protein
MTNSDEYLAWLECDCEVCEALGAVAHEKSTHDALFSQTARECKMYRAWCNAELTHHTNRFCAYEDCDQHPAEDSTLCEGHLEDDARERTEQQLRLL